MYSKIINPKTGRPVNVTGKLGRLILENYINVLQGGMPRDSKIQTKQTTPCGGKRERVCNARDQCNWIPAVFGSGKIKSMGKCVKKEVVEEEEEVSEWDGVRPLTFPADAYTSVGKVHRSSQMSELWGYGFDHPEWVSLKKLKSKLGNARWARDYGWSLEKAIDFSNLKINDVVIDVNPDYVNVDDTASVWLVAPKNPGSKTLGLHIFKTGLGEVADWNRGFGDGDWYNPNGDIIHPLNGKLVKDLVFKY